jgi:hypothetical protein
VNARTPHCGSADVEVEVEDLLEAVTCRRYEYE